MIVVSISESWSTARAGFPLPQCCKPRDNGGDRSVMTMIEYDSRPVTPQVVLIGTRASPVAYAIPDFLRRNGRPYEWIDVDDPRARSVIAEVGGDQRLLPICVLPEGARLTPASVEQVALGLGMLTPPVRNAYDLAIVGAGPAGLAASVYGSSEGLGPRSLSKRSPQVARQGRHP